MRKTSLLLILMLLTLGHAPLWAQDNVQVPDFAQLDVSFTQGQLKGTVNLHLPAYRWNNLPLGEELLTYYLKVDGITLHEGQAQPGEELSWPLTLTRGSHDVEANSRNEAGWSRAARQTLFVGLDDPLLMGHLTLAYDEATGSCHLAWPAVTRGLHQGFIDEALVQYVLTRYPAGREVARLQGLGTTTYTDVLPDGYAQPEVYYTVQALHGSGQPSDVLTSNRTHIAPEEVPWRCDFSLESDFSYFLSLAQTEGYGWEWNEYSQNVYCSSSDNDSWLITPAINLKKGKNYRLQFDYSGGGTYGSVADQLRVALGQGSDPHIYNKVGDDLTFRSSDLQHKSFTFTVVADGIYHLAFLCATPGYGTMINLDNLVVEESNGDDDRPFEGPDTPLPPQQVRLIDHFDGKHVTIAWQPSPQKGVNGANIDPATLRYNVLDMQGQCVASLISDTNCQATVDLTTATDADQQVVIFGVQAVSAEGLQSELAASTPLLAGQPYAYPFHESFTPGLGEGHFAYMQTWPEGSDNTFALTPRSADYDNYAVYWTNQAAGDWITYNMGKISLTGARQPHLVFSYFMQPRTHQTIQVVADYGTGQPDTLATIDYSTDTGTHRWVRTALPLAEGQHYVALSFRCEGWETGWQRGAFILDDIRVADMEACDLRLAHIETEEYVHAGEPFATRAVVQNLTTTPATDFRLRLFAGNELVSTLDGGTLAALADSTYILTCTFCAAQRELTNMRVELLSTADAHTDDNILDGAWTELHQSPLPQVAQAHGSQMADGRIMLSWQAPDLTDAAHVEESFEHYSPWATEGVGRWTLIDRDGAPTDMALWPPLGQPCAAIVMNMARITNVTDPDEGSYEPYYAPHSGVQLLQSCANSIYRNLPDGSDTYNCYDPTDNWIISPQLSGHAQEVSLWVKTPYGTANTFELLWTDTDATDPDYFQLIRKEQLQKQETAALWKPIRFSLPEGARHFAIRETTVPTIFDSGGLWIDDVSFEAEQPRLLGYCLYADGHLVATISADSQTHSFIPADDVGHPRYLLTALYDQGESAPVSVVMEQLPTYPRTVLIEEFTTEQCVYCPQAASDLSAFVNANPDLAACVAIVCHHAGFFTDWLTIQASCNYTWFYNSTSTFAPAFMYDRWTVPGSTSPVVNRESGAAGYKLKVEERMARPSRAAIALSATFSADQTRLTVKARVERGQPFSSVAERLTVFLTEDNVKARSQAGATGIFVHQHVLRDVNESWGAVLSWEDDVAFYEKTFTLNPDWKADDLKVVAFVSNYSGSDPTQWEVEQTATAVPVSESDAIIEPRTDDAPGFMTSYDLSGRPSINSHRGLTLMRLSDGRVVKRVKR